MRSKVACAIETYIHTLIITEQLVSNKKSRD